MAKITINIPDELPRGKAVKTAITVCKGNANASMDLRLNPKFIQVLRDRIENKCKIEIAEEININYLYE